MYPWRIPWDVPREIIDPWDLPWTQWNTWEYRREIPWANVARGTSHGMSHRVESVPWDMPWGVPCEPAGHPMGRTGHATGHPIASYTAWDVKWNPWDIPWDTPWLIPAIHITLMKAYEQTMVVPWGPLKPLRHCHNSAVKHPHEGL